ncbi:hypothetical protein DPMN_114269 [Dreissena polymorpha]|uniref:Uncharacterized protein n=1 Tax=Dreissena polymorpha TaxID=45954 RepID=A0A9D4KJQ7_DREPO|nr:hypothetical protein DPMN_114269 [Dreissena polymorpha]
MQRSPVPNYSASISPRSTKTWSQSSKRSYSDDDDDDDSDSDNDDEIVTQNNVPGKTNTCFSRFELEPVVLILELFRRYKHFQLNP